MNIDIDTVYAKFDEVIARKCTREEVANWAGLIIFNFDNQRVPQSSDSIWEALMFLIGIDLKESPSCYLHDEQNIRDAKRFLVNGNKPC